MMMKAPVGPPICTLLPPSSEMMNPATMAVMIPFSGVTPEAMPNAMASGRATMPTMTPAMRSLMNVLRLYDLRVVNNWGLKSNVVILYILSLLCVLYK